MRISEGEVSCEYWLNKDKDTLDFKTVTLSFCTDIVFDAFKKYIIVP